jgi:hypothetical protein
MNVLKNRLTVAFGAVLALAVLGYFYSEPLIAQVRAALVQNVDEPGRNPFQDRELFSCTVGSTFCNSDFTMVPGGKRLVVTSVSAFVDSSGTAPNCNLSSSSGTVAFFTGARGPVSVGSSRYFINQPLQAYFNTGETPHLFCGLNSTPDVFTSGFATAVLTGYYINLP